MPEKSGHGGSAVTKIVIALDESVSDTIMSTTLWMSKDWVSPICLGPKCSSKVWMHSGSVSQLNVRMDDTPTCCSARLAAPMPSKKRRWTMLPALSRR